MRILLVSNWFPPVISGSSYYTSSLAQSLTARGHDVRVVTLDWGPEYAPSADCPFPIHRLPVVQIPKLPIFFNLRLMGFAFTPANWRRLKAIVREFRPEVVHHVNHIFDTMFLSNAAARSAGVPVVGSITTPVQHPNPLQHRVMALADRVALGWFGVRRWDGVVCLDHMVYKYAGELYGKRVKSRAAVIPFGARQECMDLYGDRGTPRSERPQVLMAGHIHPFRNPVRLVRAMPLVLQAVPNARLVLAGRVDLQEPVEAARLLGLAADQVQFLGPTPHERTVQLMKTSHIFASWATGRYLGLGTAAMEAMLCETPVVNDLPEDLFGPGKLKNGENIVLVNSRDPRSIADALLRLLRDEELRRRIGTAGRRFVLQHLSWEGIAAQMECFYESILERRGLPAGTESRNRQELPARP